ncbi:hypothetical protein B0H10DRAFT_2060544 [Mycena sp. CBHHK59/15]|nr:hypothetical protein B0H10DRAFT_2060544 [Mycena sp. CBHHK59/15]
MLRCQCLLLLCTGQITGKHLGYSTSFANSSSRRLPLVPRERLFYSYLFTTPSHADGMPPIKGGKMWCGPR